MTRPNSKCEGHEVRGFCYICNAIYLMNIKHGNSVISHQLNTHKKRLVKPLFDQITWKEVYDLILNAFLWWMWNSINIIIELSSIKILHWIWMFQANNSIRNSFILKIFPADKNIILWNLNYSRRRRRKNRLEWNCKSKEERRKKLIRTHTYN